VSKRDTSIENKSQQASAHRRRQAREATEPDEIGRAEQYEPLAQLLRKRLEKYVSIVPLVVVGDNPDAVHDVRVWSRRLQQTLDAFFPKPQAGKVRKLRQSLRRVRRFLGDWRNCDVVLQLVLREQRKTRSGLKRRAWEQVRQYLLQKRGNQVARARKKLLRQDMIDFAGRVEKLIVQAAVNESVEELLGRLRTGIEAAWTRWESSLTQAMKTREAPDIHALRIVTKALRYRTELLHDLGDARAEPVLDWLRELQEALGVWNDRQVLYQAVAEALARPEFLLREPEVAETLLAELQKDHLRQGGAINEILRLATKHAGERQMEAWVGRASPKPAAPGQA